MVIPIEVFHIKGKHCIVNMPPSTACIHSNIPILTFKFEQANLSWVCIRYFIRQEINFSFYLSVSQTSRQHLGHREETIRETLVSWGGQARNGEMLCWLFLFDQVPVECISIFSGVFCRTQLSLGLFFNMVIASVWKENSIVNYLRE